MPAPEIVTLVAHFDIHPGKADAFRQNCESMTALHGKESGHLASAYSFDGDAKATSREDYDSAEAVMQHMQVGQHIFKSTQTLVDITGVEITGPADDLAKLRDLFRDMSPSFYVTESGFRN